MNTKLIYFCLLVSSSVFSQIQYGTPSKDAIPEKLKNYKKAIEVIHFPKENDPLKIKNTYYWKHATAILCKESNITITEFGAYLYYNNKWHLRKSYNLKDLDKNFGTKKQKLKQGEPYVWAKNWRTANQLFGGWALWYFIGTTENGTTICGYEMINTTANLIQ